MKFQLLFAALVLLLTFSISSAQDVQEPAPKSDTPSEDAQPLNFWASTADAFAIIFVAEIADKAFIMVVIFSMSNNKWLVYCGVTISMVFMHTIATFLGGVFPLVFNHEVIKWGAVSIFTFFGIYLIIEGCKMKKSGGEEFEIGTVKHELVQQALIKEDSTSTNTHQQGEALVLDNRPSNQHLLLKGEEEEQTVYIPEKQASPQKKRNYCQRCFDNAFFKMAAICFLSEMGDRSQIAAVALAAANNVWGVWLGGAVVSAGLILRLMSYARRLEWAVGLFWWARYRHVF